MPGHLINKNALVLRVTCGTAEMPGGDTYELSTSVDNAPLIQNKRTGLFWKINWDELLNMARAAGIDEETPDAE